MARSYDLERFRTAQADRHAGYDAALGEVRRGAKRGHWIWYVFPQLQGLGMSSMSRTYGIDGRDEAAAYLRDPLLRARLLEITRAAHEHVVQQRDASLRTLMGSSIDAQKLVSSMTLFGRVARDLHSEEPLADYEELARLADDLLAAAEAEGHPPCAFTLDRLVTPSP